jgi:hypothetical protein
MNQATCDVFNSRSVTFKEMDGQPSTLPLTCQNAKKITAVTMLNKSITYARIRYKTTLYIKQPECE